MMASQQDSPNLNPVEEDIKGMNLKSGNSSDDEQSDTMEMKPRVKQEGHAEEGDDTPTLDDDDSVKREGGHSAQALAKPSSRISSYDGSNDEEIIGGEVTLKQEPGQPPKLERSATQKITGRSIPFFHNYEDKTEEAKGTFSGDRKLYIFFKVAGRHGSCNGLRLCRGVG